MALYKYSSFSYLVLAENHDLAGCNFSTIFMFCRKFAILAVPRKFLQFL